MTNDLDDADRRLRRGCLFCPFITLIVVVAAISLGVFFAKALPDGLRLISYIPLALSGVVAWWICSSIGIREMPPPGSVNLPSPNDPFKDWRLK